MKPLLHFHSVTTLRSFLLHFSPTPTFLRRTPPAPLPSFFSSSSLPPNTRPEPPLIRRITMGTTPPQQQQPPPLQEAGAVTARVVQVKESIEITETERKIFDRLLNTLRHFNLQTELRVAGGWVRDKLLGKDCYDIDVAIDNMLGSEFVDKVVEYLKTTGEEVKGVGVIARNPDQSKHLETARIRLFDLWIDFVNLRCEDYSENSRIPTMKFGTAEEDAYRRDLTINSLFYNINTSSVEDLTGRGIEDLKSGKIVTPLPPKETFLDDPLRVLRAIRFGARFEFELDEQLKNAAASDDVKCALGAKVSKERIGTEIDLMISGNQPTKAMTYIADLTLFWVVFGLPPKYEPEVSEECYRLYVAYLDAAWSLIQSIGSSSFTDEQRRLALYAALFLPLRDTVYTDDKRKENHVVNFIFKDALKRKASDPETVIRIHRKLKEFVTLIPLLTSEEDIQSADIEWDMDFDVPTTSKLRVFAGFLLREIKDFWRVALLISTMLYPTNTSSTQYFLDKQFQLDKRRDLFKAVEDAIIKLGLEKIWDVKPLVNGKDIMSILQLSGRDIGKWQRNVLAWQLAHPAGTTEECLDWMRHSKRAKLE
ncbi:hypothetical protein Tsubulata_037776 [Turnera subulata]|uniref:Poly A polymerase head domain-containing protein n=1 Tax=Turnera subulata TaxID=218843 RepID=A0A9Q0FVX1_9ROSI|nr:hypothetical protein Tsubulata_037776 [Turnera subulata]